MGMDGKEHQEQSKRKISESLLNNLNAEKWTEVRVIDMLLRMIDWLKQPQEVQVYSITQTKAGNKKAKVFDEDLQDNPKADFCSVKTIEKKPHLKKEVLLEFEIYNRNWFSEMTEKFKDNKTVSVLIETISDLCEVNSYNSAVNGSCDASMVKQNLSTHYGWADKKENSNTENSILQLQFNGTTGVKPITSESDIEDAE